MKQIKRILCFLLSTVLLVLLMPIPKAEAVPTQAEVDEKIRWIIAGIPDECDTDYEKALYLHDYLCKTVTYDESYSADEAYNALIYGRADCGGYADAYRRLLLAVGIRCCFVLGYAGNDSHAWNMIMLDGKCYFTDVTWDDNDDIYNRYGWIKHEYFMIPFEEMEKDHSAFKIITATDYSFYLPEECKHTEYIYTYKDTGKPGSGHFNNATTPEEAARHFVVTKVDGTTVTWRCDFQFDGNASQWVSANETQIGIILGCPSDMAGGMDGYGVLIYKGEVAFTPTESLSFAEPTVHLNNSQMRRQLSVNFVPADASYQNVTYSSSDPRIAKVDENGVVRAVSSGTAIVTATAVDGKTATCQIIVDHQHDAIRAVPATEANCLNKGCTAHYACDSCGTLFSDAQGNNIVSIMDVVLPTTSCITRTNMSNEDGHWQVCVCGKWMTTQILEHFDADGDGLCDGFGGENRCGYVMNPSATKPTTKPTAPPTQPPETAPSTPNTAPPTQPATEPTPEPPTSATEATSEPTVPTTESVPEDTANTQTATEPSAKPTTPDHAGDFSLEPDARPQIVLWISLGLLAAAAIAAGIIVIYRKKRRDNENTAN